MTEKFYTTTEAAAMLRVDPLTIREYIASGKLPATKPAGKWLIPQESVNNFLQSDAALTDQEWAVMRLLQTDKSSLTVKTISGATGIPESSARKILAKLAKLNRITIARSRHNCYLYRVRKARK
ncbi:MAG: helix-turn-helix domain-containing protein [Dehalococcoidia bacterium]|jgi:excisionase family DNA binding protein